VLTKTKQNKTINCDMSIIYKLKEVLHYFMRKVFAALSFWIRFFESDVAKQWKVQEESLRTFEQRKKMKMVSGLFVPYSFRIYLHKQVDRSGDFF